MSDIWFCCKKTDKVVELSDCLECKEPKNCLSLASYKQGRADKYQEIISEYMLMTEELLKHNINDAIDDFAKTLISEVEKYEDSFGGVGVHYTVFMDMIKGVWQELKEQKNE